MLCSDWCLKKQPYNQKAVLIDLPAAKSVEDIEKLLPFRSDTTVIVAA